MQKLVWWKTSLPRRGRPFKPSILRARAVWKAVCGKWEEEREGWGGGGIPPVALPGPFALAFSLALALALPLPLVLPRT